MPNDTIRVRFAPSPTGYLHVGGLRTALYNYLFAKNNGGKFILRIEDTDRARYVEGAVENLLETIKWSGLEYDEGPDKPGDFGPYMQSQRLEIYKEYASQLINDKKAYYCFCTPERLSALREEQQKMKLPQAKYDKKCLHLPADEVNARLEAGENHVVRLNVEPGPKVVINDIVRGRVEFDRSTIDDQVLIKGDGFPTYHMANVVDDYLMKISHVIRGEEWLTSTPKHVLLYENLGWDLPQFAHLPLLLNSDKSKLSKRQGDVAVEDYKAKGYLKEALLNFVALLGWSSPDKEEVLSMDKMIKEFSLEKVHKAGAIFNVEKLNWVQTEHLKNTDETVLLDQLKDILSKSIYADLEFSDEYLSRALKSMIERITFVDEMLEKAYYYFEEPKSYEEAAVAKGWKPETKNYLTELANDFRNMPGETHDDFMNTLGESAKRQEIGKGKLMLPTRLAVSGTGQGPGMFDLLSILGTDEVIKRINKAIEELG